MCNGDACRWTAALCEGCRCFAGVGCHACRQQTDPAVCTHGGAQTGAKAAVHAGSSCKACGCLIRGPGIQVTDTQAGHQVCRVVLPSASQPVTLVGARRPQHNTICSVCRSTETTERCNL